MPERGGSRIYQVIQDALTGVGAPQQVLDRIGCSCRRPGLTKLNCERATGSHAVGFVTKVPRPAVMNRHRSIKTIVALLSAALFVLCSGPVDLALASHAAGAQSWDAGGLFAAGTHSPHSSPSLASCDSDLTLGAAPPSPQPVKAVRVGAMSPAVASAPDFSLPSIQYSGAASPTGCFSLIRQSVQIQI